MCYLRGPPAFHSRGLNILQIKDFKAVARSMGFIPKTSGHLGDEYRRKARSLENLWPE